MSELVAWLLVVFLGTLLGWSIRDNRVLSEQLETVRDRRDDAVDRLNRARADMFTGSSFTPRRRRRAQSGWTPDPIIKAGHRERFWEESP